MLTFFGRISTAEGGHLPPRTYTATCSRDGATWLVYIAEFNRSARARGRSQVEAVARRLLAECTDAAPTARVRLEFDAPGNVLDLLAAAAAARIDADRVSVEWVTLRRDVARRLADRGFSVRDSAALLGISLARAQQLIGGAAPAAAHGQTVHPRAGDPPRRTGSTMMANGRSKPHGSYRHEAFFYRGDDGFLAGTVPFVRDGVAAGQPVMVAVTRPRLDLLRTALADDARGVYFVDMAELGHNPARIIPGWRGFVDEHAGPGRPVRGVGEPIWRGRRATEIAECQLHEALLNLVVEPDTPLWLRCPYDTQALDAPLVQEAQHSHPAIIEDDAYRGSTAYGGAHHVGEMFARPLPAPSATAAHVPFEGTDLAELRRLVTRHAIDAGLGAGRARDLSLALSEITTNSVRHGGGGGTLSVWQEPDALVLQVTDQGHIDDPLVGRRMPAPLDKGGRGVWLANQLCDLVQIRSGPLGTTVRVHAWTSRRAAVSC